MEGWSFQPDAFMRIPEIQTALLVRFRHPGYWAAALGLLLMPLSALLVMPSTPSRMGAVAKCLAIVVLWAPGLVLCPAPWQWTGDDRALAGWFRGLLQALLFSVLLAALMVAPYHLLLHFAGDLKQGGVSYLTGMWTGLSFSVFILLGPVGAGVARMEKLAQEARAAKARAREAQWMSHRGAFSPRLLFSNLDHLADLAPADSRGTEQGLVDLAALYRQWLVEAEKPLVPMAAERALCEQYLALERRRWGENLKARWHIDPELDGRLVPSLLLLPLLECIMAPGSEGGPLKLDFRTRSASTGVLLLVGVQGNTPPPAEEILRGMKQRIRTVTDRDGEALLEVVEGGWEVVINIPELRP